MSERDSRSPSSYRELLSWASSLSPANENPEVIKHIRTLAAEDDNGLRIEERMEGVKKLLEMHQDGCQFVTDQPHWSTILTPAGSFLPVPRTGDVEFLFISKQQVAVVDIKARSLKFCFRLDRSRWTALGISGDGKRLIFGYANNSIEVYNLRSRTREYTLTKAGVTTTIICSNDGTTLFSGSTDKIIRSWDLSQRDLRFSLEGHTGAITALVMDSNNEHLFSSAEDNQVKIWDLTTPKMIKSISCTHSVVTALALSHSEETLAFGDRSGQIRLWNVHREYEEGSFKAHSDEILDMQFCCSSPVDAPDYLISSARDKISISNVKSHLEEHSIASEGADRHMFALGYESGYFLTSARQRGSIRVQNIEEVTNAELSQSLSHQQEYEHFHLGGHSEDITSVIVSRDGRKIFTASQDKSIKVWDRQSRIEEANFLGHTSSVTAMVLNQDESVLFSGSSDRTIKLWDLKQWKDAGTLSSHKAGITTVAIDKNGKRLVSGSLDGIIKGWNVALKGVEFSFKAHQQVVSAIALSSDGRKLITGSSDQTLKVWNLAKRAEEFAHSEPAGRITSLLMSGDGKKLFFGSRDYSIRVWTLDTLTEDYSLRGHKSLVTDLKLTRGENLLVSCGHDTTIKGWNLETRTEQFTFVDPSAAVSALTVTYDGRYVVAGNDAGIVRMWEISPAFEDSTFYPHSHQVIPRVMTKNADRIFGCDQNHSIIVWNSARYGIDYALHGHTHIIVAMALSLDGNRLAAVDQSSNVRVWSLQTHKEVFSQTERESYIASIALSSDGRTLYYGNGTEGQHIKVVDTKVFEEQKKLEGHPREITCISISDDDEYLISASKDRSVRVWDLDKSSEAVILRDVLSEVTAIIMSNDLSFAFLAFVDNTIECWSLRHRARSHLFIGHQEPITSLAFNTDATELISITEKNSLKRWNLDKRTIVHSTRAYAHSIYSMVATPEGQIVTGSSDKTLKMTSLDTGNEFWTMKGHNDQVTAVTVVEGGKTLASGGRDAQIKLWSLETGSTEQQLQKHDESITVLAAGSHHSDYMASGSDEGRVRVWNTVHKSQIFEFEEHTGAITALVLSFDSNFVVSGGADSTIMVNYLRDGSMNEVESVQLGNHGPCVNSLALTHDGKTLYSGSSDASIKIWNIPTRSESFIISGDYGSVTHLRLDHLKRRLISGHCHENCSVEVKVWDVQTMSEEFHFRWNSEKLTDVTLSCDGQKVVASCFEGTVKVFSMAYSGSDTSTKMRSIGNVLTHSADVPPQILKTALQQGLCARLKPLDITVLHVYAYLENLEVISALFQLTFQFPELIRPLTRDVLGMNPLDVAVKTRNRLVIKKFLHYTEKLPMGWLSDPSQTFLLLIKTYPHMPEVIQCLDSRFFTHPSTGNKIYKLEVPQVVFYHKESNLYTLDETTEKFLGDCCEKETDRPTFAVSKGETQFYCNIQQADLIDFDNLSISFFQKLAHLIRDSSHPIYGSTMISLILGYKWSQVRPLYVRDFIIWIVFLLIYSVYCFGVFHDKLENTYGYRLSGIILWLLLVLMIGLFALQELKTVRLSPTFREYLFNHWNVVDAIVVFTATCGLTIDGMELTFADTKHDQTSFVVQVVKGFYGFLFIVLGVKLFYFLRAFRETGFLVNMVTQVIIRTTNFLLLIGIGILTFGAAFYMLQRESGDFYTNDESSTTEMIFLAYVMLLGDTKQIDSFVSGWIRVIFTLYTLFNVIIMLNLLIAVIGDTFDRVQDGAVRAWNAEILKIIIEYIIKSRDQGQERTYLYVVRPLVDENSLGDAGIEETNQWRGRIREITKDVERKLKRQSIDLTTRINASIDQQLQEKFEAHFQLVESRLRSHNQALRSEFRGDLKEIVAGIKELKAIVKPDVVDIRESSRYER